MSEINSISVSARPRFKDLTGQVFSRLTVIDYAGRRGRKSLWNCLCECGSTKVLLGTAISHGSIKSCGCLRYERVNESSTSHGLSQTPEYRVWADMWQRCTNPNHKAYGEYASRRPPETWRDFAVFLEDVGPRPHEGLSLDRVDNDAPYGPGNCRWATPTTQQNNTSRNVLLTYEGGN